ncbi:MAG: hypothetical protein QOK31_706, partial [Solirubrobacteraceae bacterium]|nr:hypothetical protein [Solirubrobacteraceae bacterium]
EQPLTYWNAEGALAGMGLVLCARLAGDPARSRRTRMLAAGVTPALAVGLWLVYSRGALAATGAGLVVLAAAAPTWSQLRSLAVTLVLAGAAIVPVTFFATISSAAGGARAERNGAIYLAVLLLLAGVGAAATREGIRRERSGRLATGRVPLPRGSTLLATIVVVAGAAALIYFASRERARPIRGGSAATAARLTNIDSNRYAYWKVAGRALGDHPLKGLGAGGFANAWIQQRPVRDPAVYAHSLELETGANLGIVGLLGLAGLLGGVGVAATRAQRLRPELVAGWSAATVVWLLHSSIDWDWEMPAVTLVALTLGGALVGVADGPGEPGGAPEPPARLTAHNLETARRARAPEDQPSS